MKYQIQFYQSGNIEQIQKQMSQIFGQNVDVEIDGHVLTIEVVNPVTTTTVKNIQAYTGAVSYIPATKTVTAQAGFALPGILGIIAGIFAIIFVAYKKYFRGGFPK